jgi:putative transcriptional regulator
MSALLFLKAQLSHAQDYLSVLMIMEGIFMAVTNNIREIREQRGIYQNDLAAAIGYSTKTVGRIERGDSTPSAEFMLQISKYFNMLVEDVFHVED